MPSKLDRGCTDGKHLRFLSDDGEAGGWGALGQEVSMTFVRTHAAETETHIKYVCAHKHVCAHVWGYTALAQTVGI